MKRIASEIVKDGQAMGLRGVANVFKFAQWQGADLDEPEGTRYMTISATVAATISSALGWAQGQMIVLEEKNAELVAINSALERRLSPTIQDPPKPPDSFTKEEGAAAVGAVIDRRLGRLGDPE